MSRRWTRSGLSVVLLIMSYGANAAKSEERWLAYSKTAVGITGNIRLSPTRLVMVRQTFPLKVITDNPNFDVSIFQGDSHPVQARVLMVLRRMDPKLLNGNTFGCGRPIKWIAVWRENQGSMLGLAAFSGETIPTSVRGAGFCGSYHYTRL